MIDTLRAIADEVCRAVKLVPDGEKRAVEVSMGADGTPTAEIDKIAENIVLRYIVSKNIPLNILSEEIGFVDNGAEDTLVLDPIDGTTNAIVGIPLYTISMAIGKRSLSDIHTAYIRNVVTGEEYTAVKGCGAFADGKRITVNKSLNPKKIRMMIYLGYGATSRAYALTKRVKSTRALGCASLEMTYVANGIADGYFMESENYERSIRIVDIAASALILREAGGEIYTMDGDQLDMPFDLEHRANFIAVSNHDVYDHVMKENSLLSSFDRKLRYGICANTTIPFVVDIARRVIKALGSETYIVESELADAMGVEGCGMADMDIDVLITIGGDGTILRALQNTDAAVIGINAGGVGFLTEISLGEIESGISRLLRGDYTLQKRAKITVSQNGEILGQALNEVVLHTASVAKIRRFKVYVNDSLATDVRSDGILLSTPTGSTSYAMSLGGPIMDYRVEAWLMVPMAAFKYSSKQMVIPSSTKVTVEAVLNKECFLVIDGQKEIPIAGGSKIEMTKSQKSATFIVFSNDFYSRVKEKLGNSL